MKCFIVFAFMIIIQISVFCTNDETTIYAKRKILILPFQSKNMAAEYDYLSKFIMESVRAKLSESGRYEFSKFESTENELRYNFKYMNYNDIKFAEYLAAQLLSDTVITGFFKTEKNKVIVVINIIDAIKGKLVSVVKSEGEIGNLIDVMDQAVAEMSERIDRELPQIEQKLYNDIMYRNYKFYLTPAKKAGISLIFTGESIMLFGIFIIPSLYYYYTEYVRSPGRLYYYYDIYRAYLVGTICYLIGVTALISIGLSLTLVTIRKKIKLTIGFNDRNERFNNELNLSLRIRI